MIVATAPADVCMCGHPKVAHLHLRHGSDCSLCRRTCARYRKTERLHRTVVSRVGTALHRLRRVG